MDWLATFAAALAGGGFGAWAGAHASHNLWLRSERRTVYADHIRNVDAATEAADNYAERARDCADTRRRMDQRGDDTEGQRNAAHAKLQAAQEARRQLEVDQRRVEDHLAELELVATKSLFRKLQGSASQFRPFEGLPEAPTHQQITQAVNEWADQSDKRDEEREQLLEAIRTELKIRAV